MKNQENKQSLEYISKTLLAGGIAGCAAKTAIAPLDRVKILFQTSNPRYEKYSGTFFGVFRAGYDILQSQGLTGLFQGHSATLLRIFPYAAIKFMSYEQLKYIMMPNPTDETNLKKFMAGSLAGCISVFFSYPLDILRVRLALEVKSGMPLSLISTAKIIYNEPSWITCNSRFCKPITSFLNFYKGFMPTIYGMIPYAGVSFLTYESIKNYAFTNFTEYTLVDPNDPKSRLKAWAYLSAGAISGILAQTASYPFEVIRRNMQIAGTQNALAYQNTLGTAMYIFKRKGLRGFWVGLSIGYMKVTPMFAISFYTYEYAKKLLEIDS